MHTFRTHKCNELRAEDAGKQVRLSGWIYSKRDHGNLMFIDLRDNYGRTQCVIDTDNPCFEGLSKVRVESTIRIDGEVLLRAPETVNEKLPTGKIEVAIKDFEVLGDAAVLPFPVNGDASDLSE